MKKRTVYTIVFSSLAVALAVTVVIANGDKLKFWAPKGNAEEYKVVLNKDNYATVEEVGTFDNPKTDEKLATRKTALGNDKVFQFASGKGVTNNDGGKTPEKFCQMPGSQYGWVTNKDPLLGVYKLKVTVQQSAAVFRVDLSDNHTLEDYYYTKYPSYVTYRTQEYTGSTSYEIDLSGSFNYFRLQNLGSSSLSLVSLEIIYTCKAPSYRGVLRTGCDPIEVKPITVSRGGTLTVDYKYVDPVTDETNGVSLFFGSDETNRFGNYKIFYNQLETTYNGITFEKLDDGYNRMTIDASKLDKVRSECVAPTTISQISFKWFEATKGVYFDVKSEPAGEVTRGALYTNAGETYTFPKPYTVSEGGTIIVDYKFKDPVTDEKNGVSIYFGSDETNRFGNYKLLCYSLEETYNGITFTTLDDGYNRMTIDINKLNKVSSGCVAPTTISQISFRWFEVTQGVYFDVNPQNKTTEFKMKGSNFVIANFTDIHVTNQSMISDTGTTGKTIKYGIQKSQPDIMLFSGDIAGSTTDLDYLIPYLDSFEIPYFFIMGNHDHDFLSYNILAKYLNQSQYGYIELGPESLGSQGNYTIKIKNSEDELVHSLIMMDTGNKYTITDDSNVEYFTGTKVDGVKYGSFNSKSTYCDGTSGKGNAWDGIRGDQVTWFSNTAKTLGCETSLVIHAGFNEYVKAYEQYKDAVNKKDQAKIDACEPIGKCSMGEQVCGTVEKTGLFDAIKKVGTKNVICGHDHSNDFSLLYEGVRLTYSLKTGEGSYWVESGERNGYTELTINSSGQTSLDQVYYNPLTN